MVIKEILLDKQNLCEIIHIHMFINVQGNKFITPINHYWLQYYPWCEVE